jgi:hypothetical protein
MSLIYLISFVLILHIPSLSFVGPKIFLILSFQIPLVCFLLFLLKTHVSKVIVPLYRPIFPNPTIPGVIAVLCVSVTSILIGSAVPIVGQ